MHTTLKNTMRLGMTMVLVLSLISVLVAPVEAVTSTNLKRKGKAAAVATARLLLPLQAAILVAAAAEAACDPGVCKMETDLSTVATRIVPIIAPLSEGALSPLFGDVSIPSSLVEAFNSLLSAQVQYSADFQMLFTTASRLRMAQAIGDTSAAEIQSEALTQAMSDTDTSRLTAVNAFMMARETLLNSGLPDPVITEQ